MRNLENIKGSRIYGRRVNKPLKAESQKRLDKWLPTIEINPLEGEGVYDPKSFFQGAVDQLALEIGFGKGEHLAWQAAHNPKTGFFGCEPFINGVSGLVDQLDADDLKNVRVIINDARLFLDRLPDGCLDRAFILFPDPWPKKRHHKRRVVNQGNINQLARVLKPGSELRIGTDHRDYCHWILAHMLRSDDFDWLGEGPDDWHVRPDDWPGTRYEAKALEQGRTSTYMRFKRR